MPAYGRSRAITGSGLSSIVAQQGRRGIVKSIQTRTVTIANGALTGTDTFTAVDLNNSVIQLLGQDDSGSSGNLTASAFMGLSASGTTMTGTRTGTTNTLIGSYEIVEYYPGVIKSVQRGTKTINGSAFTYDQTITTVDITKCSLPNMGFTGDTNAFDGHTGAGQQYRALTSATNLRFTSGWNGGGQTITQYWQVVEFY